MPRSRGGSRPAPMRRPAPAPQQQHAAPARASAPPPSVPAHHAAPPPAVQQQGGGGGGLMGGLLGSVMQGAALGTGSAMAHRAMDSVMGPRTVVHEHQGAPAPAGAGDAAAFSGGGGGMAAAQQQGPCAAQAVKFAECVEKTGGDMTACEYYLSALQACKMNSAGFQQA